MSFHRRRESIKRTSPGSQRVMSALVLCGPSGCGKSTLMKRLMAEFEDKFGFSVSHTTRSPRPGEEEGREYHFVTPAEMAELKAEGAMVETAEFAGNHYGTSKRAVEEVMNGGKICILDIDVQGVKSVKEIDLSPQPRFVFIRPPSLEVLEKRLRERGSGETEEAINKRLSSAASELEYGEKEGNFDVVITNDELEVAYQTLKKFIFE